MLIAGRNSDDLSFAAFAVLVGILSVAHTALRNRRRVRWAVHATAEVIAPGAVPPLARPVVDAVSAALADLGFEQVLLTRARRAVIRGDPRYWYRAAALDRGAMEGASIEWWYQPDRLSSAPRWVSDVWVRMFCYGGPTGYTMVERRVAISARSDQGRWAYDLVSDGVSLAAQRTALRRAAGDTPARPFPFQTTEQLIKLIEAETDHAMAAALAKTTRLDRAGRWYVWTWKAALVNALRLRRVKVDRTSADRGFPVAVHDSASRARQR